MRVGSRKLGLTVEWRYETVGPGTRLDPTFNVVALDVGGSLQPGIIDQHQDGVTCSTAELVIRHPEYAYGYLMNAWLEQELAGNPVAGRTWSPCLVTHASPDFDALVSCYLIRRLVEDGAFPGCGKELAAYAGRVDSGRCKVDLAKPESAKTPAHMAWLVLQHARASLQTGFELLDLLVAWWLKHGGRVPFEHLGQWRGDQRFVAAARDLDDDFEGRQAFLKARLPPVEVSLPAADGGAPIKVAAFFASGESAAMLNKYWVRAAEYPLFATVGLGPSRILNPDQSGVISS